jgi:hypothetical protein
MAIHHQEQQMIPYALASGLGGIEEGFDLSWIKEVLRSVRISDQRTFNIIRCGEVEHLWVGEWGTAFWYWDCRIWRWLADSHNE